LTVKKAIFKWFFHKIQSWYFYELLGPVLQKAQQIFTFFKAGILLLARVVLGLLYFLLHLLKKNWPFSGLEKVCGLVLSMTYLFSRDTIDN
jgi:uncharacterized membrane protein HdeD (DUF308 family)